MLRFADVQLLGGAAVAATAAAAIVVAWLRRAEIGVAAVIAGAAAAVVADGLVFDDLPRPLVDVRLATVGAVLVALLAGWGATRVGAAPGVPFGLATLLVGAALLGVWTGLPETSGALLASGVLAGVATVSTLAKAPFTPGATFLVGGLPAAATLVGAVRDPQALAGGLLGSTLLVLLAAGPPVNPSLRSPLVWVAVLLQLASAVAAARIIGVASDWNGLPLGLALTVAAAAGGAYVLWSGRRLGADA